MLRFLTAGESHGQALVVIVEGVPGRTGARCRRPRRPICARRQLGYGRGRRMAIEQDRAEILSGVRRGETLGGPIALLIPQPGLGELAAHDERRGRARRGAAGARRAAGHAAAAGPRRPGRRAEVRPRRHARHPRARQRARDRRARRRRRRRARSSSRRVGIEVASHVIAIGGVGARRSARRHLRRSPRRSPPTTPLRCVDPAVAAAMMRGDRRGAEAGDTVGGAFEVIAHGVPARPRQLRAVGSQARRPAGAGADVDSRHQGGRHRPRRRRSADLPGSRVHDEILPPARTPAGTSRRRRPTNNAGGLEGGVTNGEDVRVTGLMKPISTLMKPLRSVDLATMTEAPAAIERSDVCAVPAAAVVGEAMVCLVLADALLEKFGGDSIAEIDAACAALDRRSRRRLADSDRA